MKLLVQTSVLDFMPNACTEEGMMEAGTAWPSCCWKRLLTTEMKPGDGEPAAQQETHLRTATGPQEPWGEKCTDKHALSMSQINSSAYQISVQE